MMFKYVTSDCRLSRIYVTALLSIYFPISSFSPSRFIMTKDQSDNKEGRRDREKEETERGTE